MTDVDAERAKALATDIGGRFATDPDAAFDGADAVIVAASTDAHATLVRAAVDRGLTVFCEKPLAFDLEETVASSSTSRGPGPSSTSASSVGFDPAYVEARAARRDAASWARSTWSGSSPTTTSRRPRTYIPRSGGLFRDSSIHDFDALRWMTGVEVAEVYASGQCAASRCSPSTTTWTRPRSSSP